MIADFFGIYGNTVVIDHGYGLLSLYGHVSNFAVKAGDAVKRGQPGSTDRIASKREQFGASGPAR